jgi:hypothetical protein
MYSTLTFYHSLIRWLVVASLFYSIVVAYRGYVRNAPFSKADNLARHWTATFAHIQLMIGIVLYSRSPVIKYFWTNFREATQDTEAIFFGLVHILLMITAIVIITIGSALSKRRQTDSEKFKTMFIWYAVALFIIFIAIPWPFSPLANRPYFR